jgi:hypothetical protein
MGDRHPRRVEEFQGEEEEAVLLGEAAAVVRETNWFIRQQEELRRRRRAVNSGLVVMALATPAERDPVIPPRGGAGLVRVQRRFDPEHRIPDLPVSDVAAAATLTVLSQGHRPGEARPAFDLLDLGEAAEVLDPMPLLRSRPGSSDDARSRWSWGRRR